MHRITTMNCVGLRSLSPVYRLTHTNSPRNGRSFFDGENYQLMIQCLNNGYRISTDLIEFMEDYDTLLQNWVGLLTEYSKKWKSKLKHQSTLSSYNTTKRAQIQTVSSPEGLVRLIKALCEAIRVVINTYRQEVERMYPSKRFGISRKHYRADQMERLFRNAYSPVRRASNKLRHLHEEKKNAEEAVSNAKIDCETREFNKTSSASQLLKANDRLERKEDNLQAIEKKIARAENNVHQEKETYRQEATGIYQQCRVLEEERLNLIRKTLIEFNQAIHTVEHSTGLNAMYTKLLSTIKDEQSTRLDLDFWARTYRVTDSAEESIDEGEDEINESQPTTPTRMNLTTTQSIVETDDDQSVTDEPITPARSKSKKK